MADEPTTTDANGGQPTPEQPVQPPPQPAATPTPAAPAEKTFTQADLDRIVKERLDRERGKYGDYDDLKKRAAKLEELEAAQLSEQEKLQKRLEKLEKEANDARTLAAEKERFATTTLIRSKVVAVASRLNFNDPEDAYRFLGEGQVALSESGEVEGVEDALQKLAESRPYLLKTQGNQQRIPATEPFNPSTPGAPIRETIEQKRKRIFDRSTDLFDPDEARRKGGGVVWSKSDNQQ